MYMYEYIYIYIHVQVFIYVYINWGCSDIGMCGLFDSSGYIHMYIYIYIYTYIHTYIRIYKYIYIYSIDFKGWNSRVRRKMLREMLNRRVLAGIILVGRLGARPVWPGSNVKSGKCLQALGDLNFYKGHVEVKISSASWI